MEGKKKECNLDVSYIARLVTLGVLLSFPGRVDAEDPGSVNRRAILSGIRMLALRAQDYYHTSGLDLGGGGSFAYLQLSRLTHRPSNANGSFQLSSPTATSVQLTGTGVEMGFNSSFPVEIEATVYADSVSIIVTN